MLNLNDPEAAASYCDTHRHDTPAPPAIVHTCTPFIATPSQRLHAWSATARQIECELRADIAEWAITTGAERRRIRSMCLPAFVALRRANGQRRLALAGMQMETRRALVADVLLAAE